MHVIYELFYFDKICLFSKTLEQPKYRQLLISEECGHDVVEISNDEIMPVDELDDDNQKIVIFDYFVRHQRNQLWYAYLFINRANAGKKINCPERDSNPRQPDLMEGALADELPRLPQWSESNISYKKYRLMTLFLKKKTSSWIFYSKRC